MKTFLILTGSTGSGHISTAHALSERARKQGHQAYVQDVCTFSKGGAIIKIAHKIISEYLGILGGVIFYITDNTLCKRIRNQFWLFSNSHAFERLVRSRKPDYIIFTQKSWIPILTSYIQKNGKPCSISSVFVHYGRSIHTLRIMDPKICDHYFVFDPGSESYLIERYDIPARKIIVSFLPVPQAVFYKRSSIGHHKIIMLCTGLDTDFIKALLQQYTKTAQYNITVVVGRNNHAAKIIHHFRQYGHIHFYKNYPIGSHLKEFDIFIGKPGGAILAECIASETPIICPAHFHGEEDANRDIVSRYKIGFCIQDPKKIYETIESINFTSILPHFGVLKKDACTIILQTILQD